MLEWLSPERSPRIERSLVVGVTDFLDLWVEAAGYGDDRLLVGEASVSPLLPDQVIVLGVDDAPVIVVEASTDGIDLRHPDLSQGVDHLWYCVPAKASNRQRIVAFIHGQTGELIGVAPLPPSETPTALERLGQRGAPHAPAGIPVAVRAAATGRQAAAGATGPADGNRREHEATHIANNVFWSTEIVSGVDPDLGSYPDSTLLGPVLAAIDDTESPTPAELAAVVAPNLVRVDPVPSVSSRAGTFGGCWLVTTVISAANTAVTWYCRGPGIVRREIPGCGSGNPYGSYSVYDLVDWDAADAGR